MSELVVSTGPGEVAVQAARTLENSAVRPRTLLICHEDDALDRVALAGWLASFSELVGIVVLRETGARMKRRVRRELQRVGALRFLDVLAFRAYYKFFLAAADRAWEEQTAREFGARCPVPPDVPVLITHSPNSAAAAEFISAQRPDLMLARCKTLLKEEIFSLPTRGTFVMHPGVCPEYRNAHGCFWALANGDDARVGMTLLRIDKGVDTGPVYGYYTYNFDGARESHMRIQQRVVLENLEQLATKLTEIHADRAAALDTRGRESATWGQPWLTRYLRWKRRARRAQRGRRA